MAKRYMSDSEYEQQQYKWKHNLIDPYLLQSVVDDSRFAEEEDEKESEKLRKQELREKLWTIVSQKIEKSLTPRQRDAIYLFLLNKKQEHSAAIIGITQEAVNVRIKLGIERLKKVCGKDVEIQSILNELKIK
jgi:DNA-directed RNA polymerase specialized sigma24 family protein